jgi:hypothetical protein
MEHFVVVDEYRKHLDAHTIAVFKSWVNHAGDLGGFYQSLLSGNCSCKAYQVTHLYLPPR